MQGSYYSYWVTFHQRELGQRSLPSEDLQDSDPPVGPGIIAGRIEERQGHQGDGGSKGQGTDEAHEVANEAREAHEHLETGSNHDDALQLERERGSGIPRLVAGLWASAHPGPLLNLVTPKCYIQGQCRGKAAPRRTREKLSSDLSPCSGSGPPVGHFHLIRTFLGSSL